MSTKNEIEKAAQKQKSKNPFEQKKPEEIPVDCQFTEAELQYLYQILDEHSPTKAGRPLQDKMNLAVIEHRKKFEPKKDEA